MDFRLLLLFKNRKSGTTVKKMKLTDAVPESRDDKPLQESVENATNNKADDDGYFAKGTLADVQLDAFGAQKKKTDPAEIALVKKLDLWIMVRLSDWKPPHR